MPKRREWWAVLLAASCAETEPTAITWPPEALRYPSLVLVAPSSLERAIAQPSLDEPLYLSLDPDSAESRDLWLFLYERPPEALRISPGPLRGLDGQRACELERPDLVLRAVATPGTASFEPSTLEAVPTELLHGSVAPPDRACVHADCRLDARWLAAAPRDEMVRFFEHPDGRALLVDRAHGLDAVDLTTGTLEPLAEQPGLPLLDARVHGDRLFVLGRDGQLWVGPVLGPFSALSPPLPLSSLPVIAGGLVVGGDEPEIFAAVIYTEEDETLILEVFELKADAHERIHHSAIPPRPTVLGKLSLEWLGPGRVAGVYGRDRILKIEAREVSFAQTMPTKDLTGGIPLDFLTLLRRPEGALLVTGHEGSLWTAPEPEGPWNEIRSTVASGVGIGAVGLAILGDGVVIGDLNSGAAFVHDEAGLCFDGVMSRVYVTALGRVGDRIIAGGYGHLGLVERDW